MHKFVKFLKALHIFNIVFFLYQQFLKVTAPFKWYFLSRKDYIQLDLGSGPKKGSDGWVTVDLYGADLNWNLKYGIKLRDNSVDTIYTSHLLEHVPFQELIKLITECHRVLKPGAKFFICVPNARLFIEAYLNKSNFLGLEDMFGPAVVNTNSFIDQVNYIAYMGGEHSMMFDEENLQNLLKMQGFVNVGIRNFDANLDLSERKLESIHAVAEKRRI